MKKLIQKYWYHIIVIFGLPTFFIGFTFLYDTIGIKEKLVYGGFTCEFHIAMLFCIAIVCLLIMRTILWLISRVHPGAWWEHMLWCCAESYVTTYFFALYICLFSGEPYFTCVLESMGYIFLSFPYFYLVIILSQLISEAQQANIPVAPEEDPGRLIRFYDERHKLRLTLDREAVLKISAEYNYVKIYYIERGELKSFVLRSTMKGIEDTCSKHGLVRCHRSYFVNPDHVRILSRDRDGMIQATLDRDSTEPVPVSKKYYGDLSEIL